MINERNQSELNSYVEKKNVKLFKKRQKIKIENWISGIRSGLNQISGFWVSGFFEPEPNSDFHYSENRVFGFSN